MSQITPEYVLAILSIIGIIFGIIKFLGKNFILNMYHFIKNTTQIHDKIDEIYKEVKPNGGGSIKDVINKINERMIRTEERQKAFLNDSSYSIFETNEHGEVTFINKTFTSFFGRSLEESIGMNWIVNIHPDDRKKFLEEWNTTIKLKTNFNLNHKIINYYNIEKKVNTRATVMKKNDGTVIGWLGFIMELPIDKTY